MGLTLPTDVSTSGHVIECAVCDAQLASRPGWRLVHHAEGGHEAVFWGAVAATPAYGSARVPLPETKGGS